jgi:hypothetical protein
MCGVSLFFRIGLHALPGSSGSNPDTSKPESFGGLRVLPDDRYGSEAGDGTQVSAVRGWLFSRS